MSQIKGTDKAILEKLFGMQGGYVLDFSDRTMEQFFQDEFKINIYDTKYDFDFSSRSKANRLRGIWKAEEDALVGVIITNLTKYIEDSAILHEKEITASEKELIKKANEIGSKLLFLSGFDFNQQSGIDKLKTKAELIKNFNLSKIDDLSVNEKIYLVKVYYSYYEAILVAYYGSGIYFPTSGIDELNDYFKILRNKLIKIVNSDDTFLEIKNNKAYQTLIEPITSLYICPEFFDGVWEDFIVPQIIELREEIADKDLFENNSEIHKTDVANAFFLEAISGEIEKLNKLQIQRTNNFYKKEAPKYKEDFNHIFGEDKEQTIKHEHTHRFENNIQEKDININIKNVEENIIKKSSGKKVTLQQFPRTEWVKVSITFLDETNILLSDSKSTKPSSFEGMGCEDGRNGKADENWAFLLKLARGNGQTLPVTKKERESKKKQKQKITDILRKIFQNETDPFETDIGGVYKAKFNIRYNADKKEKPQNRYSDSEEVFSEMTAPVEEDIDGDFSQ